MALSWCSDADSKIDKLLSDSNRDVDFLIFTLEGKKNLVNNAGHMGKGGRAKVNEILASGEYDDKVMTGSFLALAVDERGSVVSTRRKYIHFLWVGPNVGVMVKGRVNSMSGGFREKFPGSAIYLQLMADLDELDEKVLEKNLLAAGGAHKPSRYDFTNAALEGTQVAASKAPLVKPTTPAVAKTTPIAAKVEVAKEFTKEAVVAKTEPVAVVQKPVAEPVKKEEAKPEPEDDPAEEPAAEEPEAPATEEAEEATAATEEPKAEEAEEAEESEEAEEATESEVASEEPATESEAIEETETEADDTAGADESSEEPTDASD